jgi:hypothetical protein
MNMTIKEFCDKHNACTDGRAWALATGATDMATLWQRDDIKPIWLVWIATQNGVLTNRELRLFACWSVRQVWFLLTDERSRNAVEVAERYAEGMATAAELAAAREAAGAAWAAARAAALAAEVARAAAWAAEVAAWAAARAAALAAEVAAEAAAEAAEAAGAAREAQTQWLRQNTQPNFVARKEGAK